MGEAHDGQLLRQWRVGAATLRSPDDGLPSRPPIALGQAWRRLESAHHASRASKPGLCSCRRAVSPCESACGTAACVDGVREEDRCALCGCAELTRGQRSHVRACRFAGAASVGLGCSGAVMRSFGARRRPFAVSVGRAQGQRADGASAAAGEALVHLPLRTFQLQVCMTLEARAATECAVRKATVPNLIIRQF